MKKKTTKTAIIKEEKVLQAIFKHATVVDKLYTAWQHEITQEVYDKLKESPLVKKWSIILL